MKKIIKILDIDGERRIGVLEDGVFTKKINLSRHTQRNYNSFCTDAYVILTELLPINAKFQLIDERGNKYTAYTKDIVEYNSIINYRHGSQYAYPIAKWKRE